MKKKYEEPEMIIDRFGENDGILTSSTSCSTELEGNLEGGDYADPRNSLFWGGETLDNFDNFNAICVIDSLEEDQ